MIQINNTKHASGLESVSGEALIELAEERMSQGLSPPPAIYRIEYRQRINWLEFPLWARPIDPEVFDRCCHEG